MTINDSIRELREQQNWSQEQMAERMGMSTNGYSKIERGETRLNLERLQQISDIFSIDLVELIAMGERSVVCLYSENSTHSSNYYGSMDNDSSATQLHIQSLTHEVEKLKLQLDHQAQLLEYKDREIALLQDMMALKADAQKNDKPS